MRQPTSNLNTAWWGKNLGDVDQEVARLASICNVRILDAGIIERVLRNDESVCGTRNPLAFKKLHDALMMHFHIREKTVGAIGQEQTHLLITAIVDRLKARLGGRLGGPDRK